MSHSAQDRSASVHRLQPLRVLLSARDRRWVRVTSFLLSRHGYDVTLASPGKLLEAAERERADVILLESPDSRVAAARNIGALQALPAAPGVLVVFGDGDEDRWPGLLGIKKWSSIDLLAAEIETAAQRRPTPLAESGPL